MGMSSSQARLLNLTSRMHQIEYSAQNLEAQKLQMANESAHVYRTYLDALDKTKIQFGHLTQNCSLDYTDATLATLENGLVDDYDGVTSPNHFLLQNSNTNEIYITSQFAEYYNLTDVRETLPDLETFLLNEGCTKNTPIYATVTDYSNVISARPIANQKISEYQSIPVSDTYELSTTLAAPQKVDVAQVMNYSATGTTPTVSSVAGTQTEVGGSFINEVTPLTESEALAQGYTIIKIPEQLANMTSNNKYILMNNIDMTGVDWSSLTCTNITLDGNGFEIQNLNAPLFDSLSGTCIIESLGLNASNIETDSTYCGALVSHIELSSDVSIDNCYLTNGTLTDTSALAQCRCAGLVGCTDGSSGSSTDLSISNSYVDFTANLSGATAVGGIIADTTPYGSAYIDNCYVNIQKNGGGPYIFPFGESNYKTVSDSYDDVTPTTYPTLGENTQSILNVASNADMERFLAYKLPNSQTNYEANLALIQNKYNAYQLAELIENFEVYKYALASGTNLSGSLTKYSAADYTLNQAEEDKYTITSSVATPESHTVKLASKDDILLQLASDVVDAKTDPSTITPTLKTYFTDDKMYSNLSYYYSNDKAKYNNIVNYIKAGNYHIALSLLNNTDFYVGYDKEFAQTNSISVNTVHHDAQEIKGGVNIPNINAIASNLVVAFRKAGKTVDENEIKTLLNNKLGTDNNTNNITLANINEVIDKYLNGDDSQATYVNNIYNYLKSGSALSVPTVYNSSKFNATRNINGTCAVEYGTKNSDTPIGYDWDKNATYYNAIAKYEAQKLFVDSQNKYVIVDDELANSNEFLTNMLKENGCILLSLTKGMSEEDMRQTNISVETCLHEVSDETELKKAEAKYEADMRKINLKDKKFDTDLAALESERNAIKTEIETLKSVVNDNVDRTFKLFS